MTRFARASGSKASNERVPEDGTSWSEMKKQIADKDQEVIASKKQKEADAVRMENYKKFLAEEKGNKSQEWCDFSDSETKKPKNNKKGKKNLSKKVTKTVVKVEDDDSGSEPETQNIDKSGISAVKINKNKKPKQKVVGKIKIEKQTEEEKNAVKKEFKKNKNQKKNKNKQNAASDKNAETNNEAATVEESDDNVEEDGVKVEQNAMNKNKKQLQNKNKRNSVAKNNNSDKNIGTNNKRATTGDVPQYNKKGHPIKRKLAKPRDNLEHKRRKVGPAINKMVVNGKEIEIVKFEGFPVMKDDYDRLLQLKKSMISKGISKSEVNVTMKLERRKAEKAFARERKKVCFHCRKAGHALSECPDIGGSGNVQTLGTGICFKCGSTEHTHFECKVQRQQVFKFAECFVCKEQGHIARQCPDNPRGMYPKGGGCNVCGDVTHLKKDCPQYQKENEDSTIMLTTNGSVEGISEDISMKKPVGSTVKKTKVVKF